MHLQSGSIWTNSVRLSRMTRLSSTIAIFVICSLSKEISKMVGQTCGFATTSRRGCRQHLGNSFEEHSHHHCKGISKDTSVPLPLLLFISKRPPSFSSLVFILISSSLSSVRPRRDQPWPLSET